MAYHYNLDNLVMKNERYLAILSSVSRNQHDAQVHINKLEDQRFRLKKVNGHRYHLYTILTVVLYYYQKEKKNSSILLKNLRNERKGPGYGDDIPFSKHNNSMVIILLAVIFRLLTGI
jgi:hypothetical protein